MIRISRINGEGESRGQQANLGSPGKMAIKTECVLCVLCCEIFVVVRFLKYKIVILSSDPVSKQIMQELSKLF